MLPFPAQGPGTGSGTRRRTRACALGPGPHPVCFPTPAPHRLNAATRCFLPRSQGFAAVKDASEPGIEDQSRCSRLLLRPSRPKHARKKDAAGARNRVTRTAGTVIQTELRKNCHIPGWVQALTKLLRVR